MDDEFAISIKKLSVNYEKNVVLREINCDIPKGKIVAIIGPNGAGKSSLLKASIGLIKSKGSVRFFGQKFSDIRKQVAYIPQRESIDWDFPITVFDLVMMGSFCNKDFSKLNKVQQKEKIFSVLQSVDLHKYHDRQIGKLSGGQQQRAFIARSLLQDASIYLMDEPFAGIDVSSSKLVVRVIKKLQEQGKTVLIVHHDLLSVSEIFDWVAILNVRMVAIGPVEDVFVKEYLQVVYGEDIDLFEEATALASLKKKGSK